MPIISDTESLAELERLGWQEYRKAAIERVFQIFRRNDTDGQPAANVADLLSDIRHYCDSRGLDFAELDRVAYAHYQEEAAR